MPGTAPLSALPKHRISVLSVLLTIVLTIVLIILGERILYDINRYFNPAYDRFGLAPQGLMQELIPTANAKTISADGTFIEPTYSTKDYETYRLLLHTAIIIPIFLLSFLFYYFLRFKRRSSPYQIISWAYLFFAFWMMIHLLGELGIYMISHYKTAGVYFVLGILIAMFTTLIILIQKRLHSRSELNPSSSA